MEDDRKPARARLSRYAAALRYRNYRLFFTGQSISLVGTWMQRIAMGWLILKLAGDNRAHAAQLLGLQGFFGQLPMCVVPPFAGVVIDRCNKKKVLLLTQSLAMVQAAVLAALVLTHHVAVWHVLVLSAALGVVNSFDMPVRQSLVVRMVERREDLPNAIALNSFIVNFSKLIGPAIAGFVIAFVGEGWCFLLNAVSYLGVLVAIVAMHVPHIAVPTDGRRALQDFREGLAYVSRSVPIRSVLMMLVLISLVGVPYTDLMPLVATDILHGGPTTLGWLRSAPGLGAIIGGLWLAGRNSATGLGRVIPLASTLFGLGLVLFAFSTRFGLSLVLLCLTGLGMMVQMASSNTIVQTIVDDDKRGRVMSLYAMAMQGSLPWGSLLAGAVAAQIGVPITLAIGGTLCVMGAAVFTGRLPAWRAEGARFLQRRADYVAPEA